MRDTIGFWVGRRGVRYTDPTTATRVYADAVLGMVGGVTRWSIQISARVHRLSQAAQKLRSREKNVKKWSSFESVLRGKGERDPA